METLDLSALTSGVVTEVGAFGLLAWVVWYTAKTLIPRTLDRVIAASETVAAAQKASTEALTAAHRDTQKTLARLTVAVIYHDATVRGVNPEAVGTHDELMARVLEV